MTYRFRPATAADLALLNGWLAGPRVAEWWHEGGEPLRFLEADLAEPGLRMWVVELDGRPFAYIQDYAVEPGSDPYFDDRPPGTRGIDQFIGEADLLNRGHGSALVRLHAESLLAEGAPQVVTDPHPANLRAIRAYLKAGFAPYGRGESPDTGPVLLMSKAP